MEAATTTAPKAPETVRPTPGLKAILGELGDVYSVFVRTLYYIVRGRRAKGAITEQMFLIGNRSLFFICVTMAFLGAIIAYQSAVQVQRLVPDMSTVGRAFTKLLIRDLAASVGAMSLATRVGAGIAAEIGSMVVTEQTDALRMCGADPIDYLVVPRFIAGTIMGGIVLILGGAVAWFAAMFIVSLSFDVSPATFINFALVKNNDVILGVVKCFTYGGAIAIVSWQRGLRAFGGSEGVGTATTEAVVGSLFAVIVLNFFISGFGHLVLPG